MPCVDISFWWIIRSLWMREKQTAKEEVFIYASLSSAFGLQTGKLWTGLMETSISTLGVSAKCVGRRAPLSPRCSSILVLREEGFGSEKRHQQYSCSFECTSEDERRLRPMTGTLVRFRVEQEEGRRQKERGGRAGGSLYMIGAIALPTCLIKCSLKNFGGKVHLVQICREQRRQPSQCCFRFFCPAD